MTDYSDLTVYLDGEFVPWDAARIHVFSPAVRYGSAVFEGIRGYWNEDHERMYVFRLDDHLRRMELSQRILRFGEIVPAGTVSDALLELLRRNDFRATVHIRSCAYLDGYGETNALGPVGCYITAVPRPTPAKVEVGCRAQISSWQRIADNVMPARAKATANYNNSRFASTQATRDGYDAAILLNSRGKVAEGHGMCLFIIRDGVAVTPSVTSDILESITRETAITLLREQGIAVEEREMDRTEFYAASEAFFCGTGAEITPIIDVDGDPIGAGVPGEITRGLQQAYFDIAYGRTDRHAEWVTAL